MVQKPQSFLVNSFSDIGMYDPFPQESETQSLFTVPEKVESFVYSQNRFSDAYSPKCIYLPSKNVLWKIMRNCASLEE